MKGRQANTMQCDSHKARYLPKKNETHFSQNLLVAGHEILLTSPKRWKQPNAVQGQDAQRSGHETSPGTLMTQRQAQMPHAE